MFLMLNILKILFQTRKAPKNKHADLFLAEKHVKIEHSLLNHIEYYYIRRMAYYL